MTATVLMKALPAVASSTQGVMSGAFKFLAVMIAVIGIIVIIFSSFKAGVVLLLLGGGAMGAMYYINKTSSKSGGGGFGNIITTITKKGSYDEDTPADKYMQFINMALIPAMSSHTDDVSTLTDYILANKEPIITNYEHAKPEQQSKMLKLLQTINNDKLDPIQIKFNELASFER